MKSFEAEATVSDDGIMTITAPEDVPAGRHRVRVVVDEADQAATDSAGRRGEARSVQADHNPAFGMWADRVDITDSWTFTRELRKRLEQRGGPGA